MFKRIIEELKDHAPLTIVGALTGIIFMVFFRSASAKTYYSFFYIFHPLHVLLSALATSAMYQRHKCSTNRKDCNFLILLIIGYVGAIGITTLSDSIMPYVGEVLLDMPHRRMHIGFLEEGLLINSMAIIGIVIAYFIPITKLPHFGHVLISTWASLFHIMMAMNGKLSVALSIAIFLFLFFAVWLPCCVSDIIFPLLFVRKKTEKATASRRKQL